MCPPHSISVAARHPTETVINPKPFMNKFQAGSGLVASERPHDPQDFVSSPPKKLRSVSMSSCGNRPVHPKSTSSEVNYACEPCKALELRWTSNTLVYNGWLNCGASCNSRFQRMLQALTASRTKSPHSRTTHEVRLPDLKPKRDVKIKQKKRQNNKKTCSNHCVVVVPK